MSSGPQFKARDGTHHDTINGAHLHNLMNERSSSGGILGVVVVVGVIIWAVSSGDWRPGAVSQSSPSAPGPSASKSWCLGAVSQIEAREAAPNPGAWRQIPPIRQEFVEHNCQAYGLRMP